MKDLHQYVLYYFSELGTQRKPSVTQLLLSQKNNFICNYRKCRESSRYNCNLIYFQDIDKFAFICATLIKNTDISLGVVIMDDNDFETLLEYKNRPESKTISINLYDTYEEEHFSYNMPLEEINARRQYVSSNVPNHSYVKPLTIGQYNNGFTVRYVTLPRV